MWTPKVKVIAKKGRPYLILRWRDRNGVPCEQATKHEVGTSAREQQTNRSRASREAADKEAELRAVPLDEEPLEAHVLAYEHFLESLGRNPKHIAGAAGRIRRVIKECAWKHLPHLDADQLEQWFRTIRKAENTSFRTINSYIESLKAWGNWMTPKRIPKNPFQHVQRRNTDSDLRRQRRALSHEEFRRLVLAAERGDEVEGMAGKDRAMLYVFAAWTGIRAGELASLNLRSLSLSGNPPTVTVEAGSSKRRRRDVLPLHSSLVDRLKIWLAGRETLSIEAPLFDLIGPRGGKRDTAEMIREDCKAAKIPERDSAGLVVDFHALRHSFVTNLARAGVPLTQAQHLARHSDPRLTSKIYTHLDEKEQAKAIAFLPNAPPAEKTG